MEPKSLYQAIVAHGKSFTIEEYCKYQIVNMVLWVEKKLPLPVGFSPVSYYI